MEKTERKIVKIKGHLREDGVPGLLIDCPFCGEIHSHGPELGLRTPPCQKGLSKEMYDIFKIVYVERCDICNKKTDFLVDYYAEICQDCKEKVTDPNVLSRIGDLVRNNELRDREINRLKIKLKRTLK